MTAPPDPEDWAQTPTIASQFPLVYEAGSRWNEMIGHCGGCKQPITPENLRGHVTRPFGGAFLVQAWGWCPCKYLSRFEYRLYPDMTMGGKKNGQWCVWAPRHTSWWARLKAWLGYNADMETL